MTQKGRMQRGASDIEIADGGQRRVAEGLQQIGGTHGKIRQMPKFTVD